MDFTFTGEQDELRRAVRDLASRRGTSADVRRAMDTDAYDAELWRLVCDQLGLPAIAVPESAGGLGGSWVDVAVVLEEAGRALLPVPLLATMTAASALAAGSGAIADLLAAVAAGETVVALAVCEDGRLDAGRLTGTAPHVVDGHLAGALVVVSGTGPQGRLLVVDTSAEGVARETPATLDPTRRQASYAFVEAVATEVGGVADAARALDLLRVALAVEAVGAARRCLEMTVDYLRTREQFGRPIGSFQALKHRVADLAVALESAASTAYYAAWAASDAPEELPVVAPLAKAVCCQAGYDIAAETIQLHGGIGFTWEHDAHLYFKRAMTSRLLLGDTVVQRRLVAERAGLAPG